LLVTHVAGFATRKKCSQRKLGAYRLVLPCGEMWLQFEAVRRVLLHSRSMRHVLLILIIAALYIVAGRLGLLLAHSQKNATLIWAPTGLSLAALILFGRKVWPGVFLGAVVANAMVGTSPFPLVAIAIGNTLEAVVGATLLATHFDPAFARLKDVIGFFVRGALLTTTISATIGVGALYLAGMIAGGGFSTVWLTWWLGDAGGAIVVAPLLLVGIRGRPRWRAIARRATSWGALALLVALLTMAFGATLVELPHALLPALLVFPVLVWAGLQLGPRGAIVGSFLASLVAIVGTARGLGPFGAVEAREGTFLVWAYVSTLGAVAMILAAAVAEREDTELSRQRAEQDRAQLSAQAQHAQRLESLGSLAGGVAHDFNNLLVAIRGNAELLGLDRQFDREQRRAMLAEIDAASAHAANLCQQLLTYAGHHRLDKQRLDLRTIIEEMMPLLRTSIPRTVELQLVGGDAQAIEGDRTQLGQILMNLVINAAESVGNAGGWVRVSVCTRDVARSYLKETFLHSEAPAGRYTVLEVSDNGSGMTPETMARIFDPFFTTKQRAGRGLGMAMVLGIVSAHKGAVKVQSHPGERTTFEVLIPVAAALEPAVEREEQFAPKPRSGGTVLLADDEERVRRTTRLLLESAGFVVIEARDGAEAVELFAIKGAGIDLLVFDVSMPGLSGTDALAKIHERHPEQPAVLMSGYDEGRVDPASGIVFVQKPFKLQALLDAIASAMQHRG
jgi:signal transduction histidine kinase/CheY-like chemotaxis protein